MTKNVESKILKRRLKGFRVWDSSQGTYTGAKAEERLNFVDLLSRFKKNVPTLRNRLKHSLSK